MERVLFEYLCAQILLNYGISEGFMKRILLNILVNYIGASSINTVVLRLLYV